MGETSEQKQLVKTKELTWLIKDHSNVVDSQTIDNLVKLIGDRDTPVQKWVVISLGEIGPRASRAIPILKAILDKEDCEWKSQSSTPAIVETLNKLGEPVKNPCE
jgi:hypothetical protein